MKIQEDHQTFFMLFWYMRMCNTPNNLKKRKFLAYDHSKIP